MKKKLISLICALSIVSTYAFLPTFGGSAFAAASDAAAKYNSSKSGVGSTWSQDNVTDNGNSSWTVSGSVGSGDDWIKHRTEFGLNGFDGVDMGSENVAQTVGHVGWTMSNPNGYEIRVSYAYNSSSRTEIAKWNMSTGEVTDQIDKSFVAIVDYESYQGDFFIDLKTKAYRLYFNNVLFSEGYVNGNKFKNLLLNVPGQGFNFNYSFTVSNVTRDVYDKGATMNDVIAYTFAERTAANKNCLWTVNGIGNIDGTDGKRLVGNIDKINGAGVYEGSNELSVISNGDNSGIGYRLRALAVDGDKAKKGCLPKDDENDNIIHQSATITPYDSNFTVGIKGIKGSSVTENKYSFGAADGININQPNHIDVLVNNKDKQCVIKAGGVTLFNGTLDMDYVGEILYMNSFLISDVVTKSYNCNVKMDSFEKSPIMIKDFTVSKDENYYEISACAIFDISGSYNYDDIKLIYTLYKVDGDNYDLVSVKSQTFDEITEDIINVEYDDVDRSHPYCLFDEVPVSDFKTGDAIKVKAQLFEADSPLIDAGETSFTIE